MKTRRQMADMSDDCDRYSSTIVGPIVIARPPAVIAARARIYGVVTIPPRCARRQPTRPAPGWMYRQMDYLRVAMGWV